MAGVAMNGCERCAGMGMLPDLGWLYAPKGSKAHFVTDAGFAYFTACGLWAEHWGMDEGAEEEWCKSCLRTEIVREWLAGNTCTHLAMTPGPIRVSPKPLKTAPEAYDFVAQLVRERRRRS